MAIHMNMGYQLVLTELIEEKKGVRAVGENVFLDNLPSDSEVYLLFYPGVMPPDKELENKLRTLWEGAAKNHFVNIGRLNDPNFRKTVNKFDIKYFPVIIVTANCKFASHPIGFEIVYVRLDSKKLLKNPDLAVDCFQKLFLLFIKEKISEVLKQPGIYDRKAIIVRLNGFVANVLKGVEFSIALLGSKLEVKWKGVYG